MDRVVPDAETKPTIIPESTPALLKQLLRLSWPIVVEQILHTCVGLTDTYLANNFIRLDPEISAQQHAAARQSMADAAAAVNTVAYFFWFFGLIIGSLGTGASVIIARAIGARHRSLANSVCGQAMAGGAVMGIALLSFMLLFAEPIAQATRLNAAGVDYTLVYLRIIAPALPLLTLLFIANACLRGAGDTLTPALVFGVVNVVNALASWGLTYGAFGLPQLGFAGIAWGTSIAWFLGGGIQIAILLHGRGGIRLFVHRLRPHWRNLKRILRIGLPNGIEGLLQWSINFALILAINQMDPTSLSAAAHGNTIRIEALSYLVAFGIATAIATMVGQSLGRRDPHRATRATYLAFAVAGGLMSLWGLFFILFPRVPAEMISDNPRIIELTAGCLYATGFCQPFFAASLIFSFAMRGAGDTLRVMIYNITTQLGVRLACGLFVILSLGWGIVAVWWVLTADLTIRGIIMYTRFVAGKWKTVKV